MSMRRRLELAEHRRGIGQRCRECGHRPGELMEFVLHTSGTLSDAPERCLSCGRALTFTLTIDRPADELEVA